MKRFWSFVVVLGLVYFIYGCTDGEDGKDGADGAGLIAPDLNYISLETESVTVDVELVNNFVEVDNVFKIVFDRPLDESTMVRILGFPYESYSGTDAHMYLSSDDPGVINVNNFYVNDHIIKVEYDYLNVSEGWILVPEGATEVSFDVYVFSLDENTDLYCYFTFDTTGNTVMASHDTIEVHVNVQ